MQEPKLLSPYKLGEIELKNRIVMAPMTRSRAIGNIPNDLMAKYYSQRATAGLIVTEGTSPSPNGLGYSRIPGLFNEDQKEGWKKITGAVHANGGKIFVQLMHTGRISHELNLPKGAKVLAPSAIKANKSMWTDQKGLQSLPEPKEMDRAEIEHTQKEYVKASQYAIEAGFDGVELHGANGYLIEQFLSPVSNQRTDEYGGSVENRCRFAVELALSVSRAIGKDKLGIRLSPYGVASDMEYYPEVDQEYIYLTKQLDNIGIVYIHIVDHSSMGAPIVPDTIKRSMRSHFSKTFILSGGYTKEKAEEDIRLEHADLIAFGKPFINNPDLVNRFENNLPLSANLDTKTFYTPGEQGYTDYPASA